MDCLERKPFRQLIPINISVLFETSEVFFVKVFKIEEPVKLSFSEHAASYKHPPSRQEGSRRLQTPSGILMHLQHLSCLGSWYCALWMWEIDFLPVRTDIVMFKSLFRMWEMCTSQHYIMHHQQRPHRSKLHQRNSLLGIEKKIKKWEVRCLNCLIWVGAWHCHFSKF